MKQYKYKDSSGFTFLEMTAVLFIIAFIIGGVVSSSHLIRQARLTSIIKEANEWKNIYGSFKTRYNAIPGDMPDAYSYWSSKSTCTNNDINIASSGCNGNGNKQIGGATKYENVLAWQHLYFSGALEFDYMGIVDGSDKAVVGDLDRNVPISKIKGGTWWMDYITLYGISSNTLTFARLSNGKVDHGILKPNEAELIDIKADDGNADTGEIISIDGLNMPVGSDCVDGTSGLKPASYVINDKDFTCQIMFLLKE